MRGRKYCFNNSINEIRDDSEISFRALPARVTPRARKIIIDHCETRNVCADSTNNASRSLGANRREIRGLDKDNRRRNVSPIRSARNTFIHTSLLVKRLMRGVLIHARIIKPTKSDISPPFAKQSTREIIARYRNNPPLFFSIWRKTLIDVSVKECDRDRSFPDVEKRAICNVI